MLEKIITTLFGSKHERDLKLLLPLLHKVNSLENWSMALSKEDIKQKTAEFKDRIQKGTELDEILPEAFAIAREAARRTLGERPYDVQILAGLVLHQGKIMEMKTGEGKTLSSVAPAYLNALSGKGVHMVTVNDYLAERDAKWMKPVFEYLDISVGFILSNMDPDRRKESYSCDITYGTNNEFGFDHLRDNMRVSGDQRAQRGYNYCIIDEIDSILIDEARTPLIISGAVQEDTTRFNEVDKLVPYLTECEKDPQTGDYPEEPVGDFKLDEKGKRVLFTDEGMNKVETLLQKNNLISGSLFDEENFEFIHYMTQAMKAHHLFHIDVDYVVQEGTVQIVDEFTGRILHGRRYSEGLHQAIEAKENIKVAQKNKTLATITFQNYFRMYDKLAGMTGTADTEAKEFTKIYNLDVVVIPTNRPIARLDEDDIIYFNEDFKFQAIADEIEEVHKKGQPILVGTISIEKSEKLSRLLKKRGIRHEILNAKNHGREAMIIGEAGAKGSVTIATNMAGRGTDIKLGGNPEVKARRIAGTEATPEEFQAALEKVSSEWQRDYEEVKSLGGLYVLGTERHESRRIDNQLRGRSGRQGDPGRSRFYVCLDDDLMRLFASDSVRNFMGRMGMDNGEPIHHRMITRSLEKAQRRVEDRNFDIRKHLLDYDNVLSEQRNFIYDQRDQILMGEDLSHRVLDTAKEMLEDIFDTYSKNKNNFTDKLPILLADLQETFLYQNDNASEEWKDLSTDAIREQVFQSLKSEIEDKENQVGKDVLNQFIRFEYLRTIDMRWQDHLEALTALREAVYLRAYAQKNPLNEYKLEGFQMFDELIQEIKTGIARRLFRVKVETNPAEKARARRVSRVQANHSGMDAFGSNRGPGPAQENRKAVQVERSTPKVGRNDPCPCGSGKKYKHCHGAS
ncbi:preprotein translocase subunit SecA [Spirochaeta cellobiosiphila]|uniref:preprotein translocase subunit SecA n=1 Tax=Spirochaeta cellobiosiphila TaxID=504483 RepID=UPI0003F83EC2|nr:preprotein translocase subunit SecA [Spirochaeta cellobiosiphila]